MIFNEEHDQVIANEVAANPINISAALEKAVRKLNRKKSNNFTFAQVSGRYYSKVVKEYDIFAFHKMKNKKYAKR